MKEKSKNINFIYKDNLEINKSDKKLFLVVWILFGFMVLSSLMVFYYIFVDRTIAKDHSTNKSLNFKLNNFNDINNYLIRSLN